jgi:phosphate transport system permease protein
LALTAVTGLALVPLVLIVVYLFQRGLSAISWDFFTKDPTGSFLGDPGGDRSAILGTLEIVGFACVLSIPAGSELRSGSLSTGVRAGSPTWSASSST